MDTYADSAQFFDDFSSGSDGNWSGKSGDWAVKNKEYSQSSNSSYYQYATAAGKIISNSATYEADLRIIDNRGDSGNWSGIIIRKTFSTDSHEQSGYLVYLRSNGNVSVFRGASNLPGASEVSTGTNPVNGFVHMRVVTNGSNIKVYVGGASAPQIDISDNLYTSGYFSLASGICHTHFDNINIIEPEADQLYPLELTTEYLSSPSGVDIITIDAAQPRFGWKLSSSRRSQVQGSYRIIVASNQSNLSSGYGDMWDSGRVYADTSVGIVYGGSSLQSGKRYFWKVMVWDNSGEASGWSPEECFETGLYNSSDWQGSWIGWDKSKCSDLSTSGIPWIWYPNENAISSAPVAMRYFRKTFDLSHPVRQVVIAIMADNLFTLYINGKDAAGGSWDDLVFQGQRGFQYIDVTDLVNSGANAIAVSAENVGTIPNPAGLICKVRVIYSDGTGPLEFSTDSSWKTNTALQTGWEQTSFNDSNWASAQQIANSGDSPWGSLALPSLKSPAPLLRKEFALDTGKTISAARLYISGLGYYDLHINGSKVGTRVLDPVQTSFDKTAFYTTYDVTSLIHQETTNCIGVELGRGFYGLRVGNVWGWESAAWNGEPRMKLQLNIQFTDGTSSFVYSDNSWMVNAGPTLADAVYCGDDYDARREKNGWDNTGYSPTGWRNADIMSAPAGQLKAQTTQPIKVAGIITPVSVTNPKTNVFVFNMGKVTSGWAVLSASAAAGTKVAIKYGEKLNADGTVNASNSFIYEPNFQMDSYIFKGEGTETFEPRFSYKGYQYVEVSGIPSLTAANLTGKAIHSSLQTVGSFSCSNSLFNTIHGNCVNAMLNNFYGIPTDCPQYEKNGWMGDGHLSSEAAMFNFDMALFYSKWINDMEDCQNQQYYSLPAVCPGSGWGIMHAPEWTAAYPFVAYGLFQYYGDTRNLANHYTGLKNYVNYEISQLDGYNTSSSALGDWLAPGMPNGNPPEGPKVSSTSYVYQELMIMSKISSLLGYGSDEAYFSAKSSDVKNGLNSNYLDAGNNQYFTDITHEYRQTNTILPVAFGIAPYVYKQGLVSRLVSDINSRQNHLNVGILGAKYFFPLLCDNGYGDLAYTVANQTTYPGYGYMVANGATALWEYWDLANTRSLDHHMLASIDEWFYKYLAGINPASPGFKSIKIKPYIIGDMTSASGHVNTVMGLVSSSWSKDSNNNLSLNVSIPANTTATVYVPAACSTDVMEGGVPAGSSQGVSYLRDEYGYAVYSLNSGTYSFTSSLAGKGWDNFANGSSVTASSTVDNSDWGLSKVNDGQRNSAGGSMGWTSNNSLNTNHTEAVAVNTGSVHLINKVDLYPRNDGTNTGYGFPVDFTIKVSADNTNWTTVVTKTGYPLPGNSVQSFMFGDINAQYVKIEGTGLRQNPNDGNLYRMQFAEIEVYGNTNLPRNSATASTSVNSDWGQEKVMDNIAGNDTGWSSSQQSQTGNQWIMLDTGANYNLRKIKVIPRIHNNIVCCFPQDFKLQYSIDGTNWTDIPGQSYTDYPNPVNNRGEVFYFSSQVNARYIRILGTKFRLDETGVYYMQICEIYPNK